MKNINSDHVVKSPFSYQNMHTHHDLIKGCLLLGGLGGEGRMLDVHSYASGDILDACVNGIGWRLNGGLRHHRLLLKVLEHLLKLTI